MIESKVHRNWKLKNLLVIFGKCLTTIKKIHLGLAMNLKDLQKLNFMM
jgi:hypothetical protein